MDIVSLALQEDIGTGDKSTEFVTPRQVRAQIISRESGVFFGSELAKECLTDTKGIWHVADGEVVEPNTVIATLVGLNTEILTKERTILNFLQTLSGTATQTRVYVERIKHTKTQILDTRKTIPGLRKWQKAAVVAGGGVNHRMGLYDAIMLKENHICGEGIAKLVNQARNVYPKTDIIVEVETLAQLQEVDTLGVTRILCDNFSLEMLQRAVGMATTPLEASGNIDEQSIVAYAETGVDFISIGSLTKHVRALDLSLGIYEL